MAANDPFSFLAQHPQYNDIRGRSARPLDLSKVKGVIWHEWGSKPGAKVDPSGAHSPYHLSITPDGRIHHVYGADQMAPHAFKANGSHLGVSYAGPVGSKPTPEAEASLRHVYDGLKKHNPDWSHRTHGEAFRETEHSHERASRDGRGMDEAAWMRSWRDGSPIATGSTSPAADAPTPVAQRGITSFAGLPSPAASDAPSTPSNAITPKTSAMIKAIDPLTGKETAYPSVDAFGAPPSTDVVARDPVSNKPQTFPGLDSFGAPRDQAVAFAQQQSQPTPVPSMVSQAIQQYGSGDNGAPSASAPDVSGSSGESGWDKFGAFSSKALAGVAAGFGEAAEAARKAPKYKTPDVNAIPMMPALGGQSVQANAPTFYGQQRFDPQKLAAILRGYTPAGS